MAWLLGIVYAVAFVWFVLWIGQRKAEKDLKRDIKPDPLDKESNYWW